jgi:hypothetical protein
LIEIHVEERVYSLLTDAPFLFNSGDQMSRHVCVNQKSVFVLQANGNQPPVN